MSTIPNYAGAERFMREEAGMPCGGEIGRQLAVKVAQVLKHRYQMNEADWLRYAKPWNEMGGNPFDIEGLRAIYWDSPPLPKRERRPKPEDPGPALFEETA